MKITDTKDLVKGNQLSAVMKEYFEQSKNQATGLSLKDPLKFNVCEY